MPLPGLKTSIELEPGPISPQLVDRDTGERLPISQTEARVLGLWDGAQTATSLSARLFVEGVDVEPWQVEQFFGRLARASLLAGGGPIVPDFVPAAPGVENPEDLVPTLRGDLVISKSANSKATLEVKDPVTGRSFTLYDFEVSIARMLDGKRTAAEVLAAANRLGIPVTLATLKTFLQQLRAYQFIDLKAGGGESTWPRRRQWSPEVRELYQGALRLMRLGKFDEARGYLEAMKAADPSNEEATALRERLEVEAKGSPELAVPFDTLHTPVSTAAVAPAPAPEVKADPFESFGFHSSPPTADQLPAIPESAAALPVPEVKRETPTPVEEPGQPERGRGLVAPRSRRPLSIAAGVGVLLLLALLRPVRGTAELPCELQVDELGTPKSPRAGEVRPALVKDGAQVEKGAVLARLTLAPDETPEVLDARLAELEAKLAKAHAPGSAKAIAKAKAAVKKAGAAVTAAQKKLKKASKSKAPALETKLLEKQTALDAAKATLADLQQPDHRAELKATLQQLSAQKVAAAVKSERSAIVAPVAGLFLAPSPAPAQLAEGAAYGRVVGPTFRVVTKEPLDPAIDSAVFVGATGRLEVQMARVKGKPELVGAKGTLEVPSGYTVWLLSVLH